MMTQFKTLDDADVTGKRVSAAGRSQRADEGWQGRRQARASNGCCRPSARSPTRAAGSSFSPISVGPRVKPNPEMSLEPLAPVLSDMLGQPVGFADDCVGPVAAGIVAALKDGNVVLLENTRFHPGEEENEEEFARQLASLGDVYRQRRLFGRPPRPCLDRGSGPASALLCRPHHAGRTGGARKGPRRSRAAGRRHRRRRQGLDQDRPSEATSSTRVDALVIGGGMANTFLARRGRRTSASRSASTTSPRRQGRSPTPPRRPAARSCCRATPSSRASSRRARRARPSRSMTVPADAMILDAGPKTVEAVNAGSTRRRRWSGTARSAPSRSSPSTPRPWRRPIMRPS